MAISSGWRGEKKEVRGKKELVHEVRSAGKVLEGGCVQRIEIC